MKSPRVALASNTGDGVQDVSLLPINSCKAHSIPPSWALVATQGIELPCRSGLPDSNPHDHAAVSFPPTSISIPISNAMVTSWNVES